MATRILHLTSPPLRGNDIAALQAQLVGAGYLDTVDGVYGPHTAQAVYRAKFWLGYLKPNQTADPNFVARFAGRMRPTPTMVILARRRLAADRLRRASEIRAERIVRYALSQLGETEHPAGSNRSKSSIWYGLTGPWCAMFVTRVHVTVGLGGRTFRRGSRYAYVPFILGDALGGRNGLALWSEPGDAILALYDWGHDGTPDHIGICAEQTTLARISPAALMEAVRRFGSLAPGEHWSIEGNTSPTSSGSQSNGGMVALRKRERSQVRAFVRVSA